MWYGRVVEEAMMADREGEWEEVRRIRKVQGRGRYWGILRCAVNYSSLRVFEVVDVEMGM